MRYKLQPRAALMVGLLCAVLPASAAAKPASAIWSGRLDNQGGTVTFQVAKAGTRITSFVMHGAYGTLHCGGTVSSGSSVGSATIAIPSARIVHGSGSTTYTRHSSSQQETDRLKLHFSGRTVRGSVSQDIAPNCGTGVLRFTAHPGGFANVAPPGATFRGVAYDQSPLSFTITRTGQRVTNVSGSFAYTCGNQPGVFKLSLGSSAEAPINLGSRDFNLQADEGDVPPAHHIVLTFEGTFTDGGRMANGSIGASFTLDDGTQCSGNQVWNAGS